MAMQWSYCSKIAEGDLRKFSSEKIFYLRYEDFVANPKYYVRELSSFLGLSAPEFLIEQAEKLVDPKRVDKWKRLDQEIIESCRPHLKDEMERHNYTFL